MDVAVPFTSQCHKISTLLCSSVDVSHTAERERKREADSTKNVMVEATEGKQMRCELKTNF